MTTTTSTWGTGYDLGVLRGQQNATAERVGLSLRDPDHKGFPDEPPHHLDEPERADWIDGFLTGYADGRRQLRGAA